MLVGGTILDDSIASLSTSHYENRWEKVDEHMSQKVKWGSLSKLNKRATLHIWIDTFSNFDTHGNFDKSEVIFK